MLWRKLQAEIVYDPRTVPSNVCGVTKLSALWWKYVVPMMISANERLPLNSVYKNTGRTEEMFVILSFPPENTSHVLLHCEL